LLRLRLPLALAAIAGLVPVYAQPAQQQMGQLDSSPILFTVLAAANAAGYDAGIDSPLSSPLRATVRDYLAKQNIPSIPALKRYLRDMRPKDTSTELSQYISFALFCAGPPDFKPVRPDVGLPPDAATLYEFPPLLAAFYQEAHIEDLWNKVQPDFDREISKYTAPASRAVLEVNAYLRNPTDGYLGRRFQIFIDLLGAPNQVQTRNYIDDYYVVITAHGDPPTDKIRHAYLHYLIDPMTIKFSDDIKKKKNLADFALASPMLSELYKGDFNLLATESFIKAIESRLDRKPAESDQALKEGFILTPAFTELLETYEKQEEAMRLYFPELVGAIDMKKEQKRLDNVAFASKPVIAPTVRTAAPEPKPVLTGAAKTLDEADTAAYTAKDYARAKQGYAKVMEQTDQKPMHAKAYYGLARIAVLERDPETGDRLFRKVLELEPDPETKAWSLLYLGKLADSQGDHTEAQSFYQQALAVPGVPDKVKEDAEKGLKSAFTGK
jgi:tetratricopeptide (TPR) repeat protein